MMSVQQQVYAVLWNKFGKRHFSTRELGFLDVFLSRGMKKKVLFNLSEAGWIKNEKRGSYRCVNPQNIFEAFFKPKMMNLLKVSVMKWCFSSLNALEVYSDFSVEHRSWLSSPFYIKVLKRDLKKWIKIFKKHDIPVYKNQTKAELGEYVVLIPKAGFKVNIVDNYPVEPLEEVIKFAKQRSFEFAFELRYLSEKYDRTIQTA